MPISERKIRLKLVQSFVEEALRILVVPGVLVAIVALLFWLSPGGQHPREFTGKIIEKRVSVYEYKEGSSFVNDLVIEEANGNRFRLSVTDEMYARASIGMWIKRTKFSLDLFTDAEWKERSP